MDDPLASQRRGKHTRHDSDTAYHTENTPLSSRHRRHESTAISHTYPVRDTQNNPFIEGGPADAGYTGPNWQPSPQTSVKQNGHTTYLFRGQRIVYDDRDVNQLLHRAVAGHGPPPITMPEPKLLFPPQNHHTSVSSGNQNRVPNTYMNPQGRQGLFDYHTERKLEHGAPAMCALPQDPDAAWLAGVAHDNGYTHNGHTSAFSTPSGTDTDYSCDAQSSCASPYSPITASGADTPIRFNTLSPNCATTPRQTAHGSSALSGTPRRSRRLANGSLEVLSKLERVDWDSDDD
ncbi:hypothetical protein MCUN1_001543 [Malassezia cuniculi]|uniref:Uncharacterized protein n=1 Tax=Malassezia cuniculi TaxID=948313 RepID=A0AAF0EUA1_9BASI|nr:hypothetical protein MCUN1_001543 [Malassezia cuniculi]